MDWDRSPWNRWSFQHMREVVPTVEVWRGDGPVQGLKRREKNFDSLTLQSLSGASTTLSSFLDETYTDGFLVMHRGAVVYEKYLNGIVAIITLRYSRVRRDMPKRHRHLATEAANSCYLKLLGLHRADNQTYPDRG